MIQLQGFISKVFLATGTSDAVDAVVVVIHCRRCSTVRRRERRVEVSHAATAAPQLLWQSLLALHHLAIDLVEVDLTDLVHHVFVVEGDKPETTVTICHFVVGQHGLFHLLREGL